mgnify:CR=1 FL=1
MSTWITSLTSVNTNRLSSDLSEFKIRPTTRQWINLIINELDLHIFNLRLIDQKRLDSCSISTIDDFFTKYSDFISQFHLIMIFGADETMLDPQPRKKVVVPKEIQVILHENLPDMAHITGMMCHNVAGVALPPFIILSKLKNLPSELNELSESQQICVASTESCFMIRDAFLL